MELNKIVDRIAEELAREVEVLEKYNEVPIGREKLSSQQVKSRYGLTITEIRHLEKTLGPERVARMLQEIGGQNARTT